MFNDNKFKYQILAELKQIINEEEFIKEDLQRTINRLNGLKNKVNNLEQIILQSNNSKEELKPNTINNNKGFDLKLRETQLQPQVINKSFSDFINSSPSEKINSTENKTSNTGWEINLGIKWLSRLGIIAVLIGFTLALSYSFQHFFTKEIKVLTFALLALIFFFAGNKLFKKYTVLGRVLQAGGITLGYLTIYASFFIESTKLFNNAGFIGYGALFLYIGFILFMAEKMASRTIAGLAFGFGYLTSVFVPNTAWAFVPAMLLNLAVLRLSWLGQFWKKLNLLCLFGSLIVYFDNYNDTYSLYFFWASFAVFHIASFFKATSVSPYFFLLNNFSFYLIYKLNNTNSLADGALEFILATINLVSYIYYLSFETEEKLTNFALITGLSFIGLGTLIYFKDNSIASLVLASLALSAGLLTRKSVLPSIYYIFSCIFLALSFTELFIYMSNNNVNSLSVLSSKIILLSHIIWVSGIAFYLQNNIYSNLNTNTNYFILISMASNFALFFGFEAIINTEYKTLSWAFIGILFLIIGFILRKRQYRYTGLIWFLLASFHLLFVDINQFEVFAKILAFTLFGLCLLAASYGYSVLEKTLLKEEKF